MALIALVTHDTPENRRSALTRETLSSLCDTVDWDRHRLFLVDNASTDPETLQALDGVRGDDFNAVGRWLLPPGAVIRNAENRGTARAANQAWQYRRPEEAAIKCDNDFVVRQSGWADLLEECVARDPALGIVGLKRKDLEERPDHEVPAYRSELHMLPHERGQRWLAVERVAHVMGTCQLYSAALLDRIGFLYQMGFKYGFDDSLAAYRCHAAGFYSAFLCGVEIDHIDPGQSDFTAWKQRAAGEAMAAYNLHRSGYAALVLDPHHGPDDDRPRLTRHGRELLGRGLLLPEWAALVGEPHAGGTS